MPFVALIVLAVVLPALLNGQPFEARLLAEPPLAPAEVADFETRVRANPADLDTRLRLLRHYMASAPSQAGVRSPFQTARLVHILYLIENSPSDPVSSTALTYVPAENGPFADAGDHATVRYSWARAVDQLPGDSNVLVNAARFLYGEHPEEAEQVLSRAVDREPANRKIAANLGFLYAMDILGMTNATSEGRAQAERERLREHARNELDRSQNVFVLAGAGTALPNLFPLTGQARDQNRDRTVFELAASLMSRARELGPQETELRGPMPLIREFREFSQTEGPRGPPPLPPTGPPSAVRIGGNVQAAKLMEKPEAVYPPLATQARIQGTVRFNIVVGADGGVENATVVSGHPLLVPAAVEVVRRYRYQPTLLNGSPVQVVTQVDVPFSLSQ